MSGICIDKEKLVPGILSIEEDFHIKTINEGEEICYLEATFSDAITFDVNSVLKNLHNKSDL